MRYYAFILQVLLATSLSCGKGIPKEALSAPEHTIAGALLEQVPLSRLLDSLKVDPQEVWFLVVKSERTFKVMTDSTELRRYTCVLGGHPVGDKRMEGDKRTPEGTFTFRSKRRPHKWQAFIHIDYPNAESKRRFAERKKSGEIPRDASIGGEVGIHGVPEGMDRWITSAQDWTLGCIALKNADVDEIYPYITPWKTKLIIQP